MSFHKTGKFLHRSGGDGEDAFAAMVSMVLRGRFEDRPASIKVVARWTGASERTVKNWFSGHCAPRGHFFRSLVLNCPEMLDAFLLSVGGGDRLAFAKLMEVQRVLKETLAQIEVLTTGTSDAP